MMKILRGKEDLAVHPKCFGAISKNLKHLYFSKNEILPINGDGVLDIRFIGEFQILMR